MRGAGFVMGRDAYKWVHERGGKVIKKKRVAYDLIHVFISVTKLAGCRASSKSWKHALLFRRRQDSQRRAWTLTWTSSAPASAWKRCSSTSKRGRPAWPTRGPPGRKGRRPSGRPPSSGTESSWRAPGWVPFSKLTHSELKFCRVILCWVFPWGCFVVYALSPVLLIEPKSKPAICFSVCGCRCGMKLEAHLIAPSQIQINRLTVRYGVQ